MFDVNTIGVIRVTQAALPLLLQSENPVVVNLCSAFGSFAAVMDPERPVSQFPDLTYSASKAAVTMLTVQYAKALPRVRPEGPTGTLQERGGVLPF